MNSAKCKGLDTDQFFEPEREDYTDRESWIFATREKLKEAQKICSGCPVINTCLRENLNAPNGVFGGMTARQRSALARKKGVYEKFDDLRHYQTPMTEDRVKIVLEYWKLNYSLADIEDLTGINRGSVSRIIHDPRFNPETPEKQLPRGYRFQKTWQDPKYAEVREMLAAGCSTPVIADKTGFHRKVVRRIKHSMVVAGGEKEMCSN